MEPSEAEKLKEAVEAGLRDGRKLESLKLALRDSGYNENDIKEVLTQVDRKRTIRRPPKKDSYRLRWFAAAIVIVVVVAIGSFILTQPGGTPTGQVTKPPEEKPNVNQTGIKICYASNETVKEWMIEAGTQCDKWYIITLA
jgi:hypothetical protein